MALKEIKTTIELRGKGANEATNVSNINENFEYLEANIGGEGVDLTAYALKTDLTGLAKTSDVATKAQGAKADSAVQPAALVEYAKTADVATKDQGAKADTAVQPAGLSTYAKTADVATKAQGAKADTAVQPAALTPLAKTADVPTNTAFDALVARVAALEIAG